MGKALSNPDHIAWEEAATAIQSFLPASAWKEKVLEISEGQPGHLEEKITVTPAPGGMGLIKSQAFTFLGVKLRIENAKGVERDAVYAIRFRWHDGEWKILDLPGVMM